MRWPGLAFKSPTFITPEIMAISSGAPTPRPAEPARGWTLFPEQGDDMVGVVLAERFELQARIGVGGMASVYACRDLAVHGRLAAVKVLREGDADTRRRFADESLLLANLWHPHLVGVQATGETEDGAPYMVLEYLPGMSLAERLVREGPLPWQEVTLLIAQVAGALSAMHRAGVIHRDIKPANIMQIDGAAGRPIAMLIDLGVAKVHDWRRVQAEGPAVAPRRPTDAGKAVGTPGFCPPEATLVPADPRSCAPGRCRTSATSGA